MSDLLDTEGVARATGLAINTLEKYRVTGEGPPFLKLGRAVRYDPNDLKAWLAARRVYSTSEKIAA